jgi:hypothetical protein
MVAMAGTAKYLMIASMDVDPEHEATFNEVYDTEHVPSLRKVPGVGRVSRYKREELTINIGGEARKVSTPGEPAYVAVFEVESPEVLTSAAWALAVEEGRWPSAVRPYTKNRRHVLLKLISDTD